MNRNVRLLFSLNGHARTHLVDEPALKIRRGLQRTASDNQRVWIEGVDHLVEKQPERVRLYAKNLTADRIPAFGQSPHELGCITDVVDLRQIVFRMFRQKMRKQRF